MPAMTDENPLPVEQKDKAPLWSENFALAVSDTGNGISFLYSIGTWYGDTTVWREKLSLELPDGSILVGRNYGRATEGNVVSASLSRYEIVEPGHSVRLTWDGPIGQRSFDELMAGFTGGLHKLLKLDVTFEAIAPIWDMKSGGEADKTEITGASHTEQLGFCRGTIAFDGNTYEVSGALSCRDHSRGKRDFSVYHMHNWINGWFPDAGRGFQLYAARAKGMEGLALAKAVIVDGGTAHPAEIVRTDFIGSPADARSLQTIILTSDLGEMTIAVTGVRTCLPVSAVEPFEAQAGRQPGQDQGMIFDETIELEWDGRKGLGWSERGIRIDLRQ